MGKEKLSQEIVYKKIEELKEHPLNDKIWGFDPEAEKFLIESIKEKGILSPIIITPEGKIVGGHRRFRVARQLGYKEVPCRIFYPESPGEEEEVFIEDNLTQRKLTPLASYKALQYYNDVKLSRDINKLKQSLIPELAEALEKGELNPAIAKALAQFSLTEQKNFLYLINMKLQGASQIKVQELQALLRKKDEQLAYARRLLENTQLELKQLKELQMKTVEKKREYEAVASKFHEEKLQLEQEKRLLEKRIKDLELEIDRLKSQPHSPELLSQIESLKIEKADKVKRIHCCPFSADLQRSG